MDVVLSLPTGDCTRHRVIPVTHTLTSVINTTLRSVQVRVSTKEAFKSLSIGLRKIYKSVRILMVTLALKSECPLDCFSELRHNGTLELSMVGVRDDQKEWLVEVVKTVGGR